MTLDKVMHSPLIVCFLAASSTSLHFYPRNCGNVRTASWVYTVKRFKTRTFSQSTIQTDSSSVPSQILYEESKVLPSEKRDPNSDDPIRSGKVVLGLYEAFNNRDIAAAAAFLDEDCVYEDLLLGPSTVCRGRDAFASALRFHPAFVTSWLFSGLPFTLPALKLIVDSVAEGVDTVGVEWHVEVGENPIPLGRGLSQVKLNPTTGTIKRVVDIAEAPWRVIGLALAPVISVFVLVFELAVLSE